jgi:peptidyl-prolyl cis-trans isomerase B (cyclophilin B)
VRSLALASGVVVALLAGGCGGGGGSPSTAGCPKVTAPKPRNTTAAVSPRPLASGRQWSLTFRTSCGTFVVTLDPGTSPHATASLVALARKRYFDDTIFHRIVPGFVIQGGDPTQSGSGGPGYTTVDTPDPSTRYAKGVVAMAKTATEPRGTAGSQFFVMTAGRPLDPDYAVVGRVTDGISVVEKIGRLGDPNDPNGTPTETVVIERVTAGSR